MHDYRSYEWEWIAENGDYVGGHPRFPQSQKVVRLGITPWELTAWSAQGHLMFSLPVETIQAVTTQFAQTSGAFLGLGAEGILEASVANVLTRKNHHGVLISAHIDQKLCAVGFDFPGLTAQLRIYDAIQARLAERLPSANTSEALSSNVAEQLREVVQLYREGFLDATEFQQAKQWILNGI